MLVLRSNLTVPIGATVRCVPRDRPSYGATACAGVFTLWWRWPGTSCASRLWIRLRGLLGLRMDDRSMDPLASFTHDSYALILHPAPKDLESSIESHVKRRID
jgi:hypothetical protein